MRLRLTQDAMNWFDGHNISFHNRFGIRLKPGDLISFRDGLTVEPYIGIHAGNSIYSMGFLSYTNSTLPDDISIGRYCSIARDISFPCWRHPIEHLSTSIFTHDRVTDLVVRFIRDQGQPYDTFHASPQKGPVVVEHDVWIGQNATLMPGITLGTGSVIAAHSVVTRSVPPYTIVGGNPAEVIKARFNQDLIDELLDTNWWNYKFTDFTTLDVSKPDEFVKQFRSLRSSLTPYSPTKILLNEVAHLCDATYYIFHN